MINVTRWRPDTCGCVLEYEWDTEVKQEDRVHIFKAIVSKCDSHIGLKEDAGHYDHVLKENQTKNKVLAEVIDKIPRLKKTKANEDGSTVDDLDPTIKYDWHFEGQDEERKLIVDLKGANLTKNDKINLKTGTDLLDKPVEIV